MADEDEEETPEMSIKDPPPSDATNETVVDEKLPTSIPEQKDENLVDEKLPSSIPEQKDENLVDEKLPTSIPEQKDENLSTELMPQGSVESRDNLVHTAVSFLQNPKVRDGPVAQKKAFLRKKGLTEEEISDAFIKSGAVEHVPQPMVPYPYPPPPVMQIPSVSSWMRIRETMVAGLLVWGISKAAHRFYTEYVSPYFDIKWPQERRLEVIENSVLEMQNNLVETMKKVQEVVGTVQHQQKQMLVLTEQLLKNMNPPSANPISLHNNDQTANEIKTELNSIKGILLSRKQFPTVPNTSTTLPVWQLNTSSPPPAPVAAAAPAPAVVAAAAAAPVVAAAPSAVADVAETPQTPQTLEPEVEASNVPNNDLDEPPAPPSNLTPAAATDVEEVSNSETAISIEDNKEVDNPNYVFVNGPSSEPQEATNKHGGSRKSKTRKDDSKKKNNNNDGMNDFSAEQTNKLDKSHVI